MIMGLTGGIASGKAPCPHCLWKREQDSWTLMSSPEKSCSRDIRCWLQLCCILEKESCCRMEH